MRAFDIGSYDGMDSVSMLESGYTVVAADASPAMFDVTKIMCERFGDQHTALFTAVGSSHDDKIFYQNPGMPQWSSVHRSVAQRNAKHEIVEIRVPCTTIDSLIEDYGRPDYIKIDIEGAELDALAGLSSPIDLISLEFDHLGITESELLQMMADKDYREYAWAPQRTNVTSGWQECDSLPWLPLSETTPVAHRWCDVFFR